MEKVLTPIIHVLFLIPLLTIAMGSSEFFARTFDLLPDYMSVYRFPYVFIMIGIIGISGIPLFWLANLLMQRIEKVNGPGKLAHFRQLYRRQAKLALLKM